MKNNDLPILTHSWSISGTVPNADQRYPNYGQNVYIGVQADSMEAALAEAKKVYPLAKFLMCNHRGAVHLIQQP